ncbi:diacylglycerol kinase [Aliikangiella coralliicola]|uniref:Diacylglycerol kinase n=1 Tax=Aliikangiella coralliicola TaxID=2592383 RepID=A0A545UJT5_9GAMM|nr:diacylglycerol kinase [Aliikangiella coralliicola]TQV89721.1 diacylglycerol kinase [Aliikangiella coralliicola]
MAKPGKTGLKRIFDATGYSIKGLEAAWKNEAAFRQEVMLAAVGIPLAFWLAETKYDLLWLILPLFLVVAAELTNSAIEAAVDRISDEHHELSGRAKDIGSALVFVCLLLLAVVWSVILLR